MTDKEARQKALRESIPDPDDMTEKRKKHPQADEKNFLAVRGIGIVLACGADKSKKRQEPGARCHSIAGFGTNHPGYGRCKYCGGNNKGAKTPEKKAKVAQNSTKHGLYAKALKGREAEIFEELHDGHAVLSLEFEINMQKAKILGYLEKQNKLWEKHYEKKLNESYVSYKCRCGQEFTRNELETSTHHCYQCGTPKEMIETIRKPIGHSEDVARAYADKMSKVYYTAGESRASYHAGTIEDNALDRAMNTLGRLVERHARIKGVDGDNLLDGINAELRAASKGNVAISWGSAPAQGRQGE